MSETPSVICCETPSPFGLWRVAGATWTAAKRASVAELMRRIGHARPWPFGYRHATEDGDQALAHALSKMAKPADVVEMPATG